MTTEAPEGVPVHPEVAANVEATASVLAELGHDIVDDAPDYGAERVHAAFGDLFAVVKIAMPDQQDDSTRELWRQMQAGSNFDPRAEWGAVR